MTRIEFYRGKDWQRLRAEGHAGYANTGRDIVCAGLSAICYALMGFLENEGAQERDCICGSALCSLLCHRTARTDAAFDMALLGLMQIEKQYPDHVHIHISATGGDAREQTAQKSPALSCARESRSGGARRKEHDNHAQHTQTA